MTDADPYENDPFFKAVPDAQWNACIGRQGHEENYLDGYIEAAIELTEAIIEKRMMGKRDTLVLPILYNARHAVEITLKFSTDRLVAAGVIRADARKRDHNLRAYWGQLHGCAVGDEMLTQTIVALEPFVESLSRVDSDGQELRYHRTQADSPSLAQYSLANLQLICTNLHELQALLMSLKIRTVDLLTERMTGTFTTRCSRRDLFTIARLLPPREDWHADTFHQQKMMLKGRYGLGNRQFAIALNRIQRNREMRAILGMQSQLLYLTDSQIAWTVEQWRRTYPKREQQEGRSEVFRLDRLRIEALRHLDAREEVVGAIDKELSAEALAELEAMFYLGRDGMYVEYYENEVARVLAEHAVVGDSRREISHLIVKANFLECLGTAARRLGRLSLAERLREM